MSNSRNNHLLAAGLVLGLFTAAALLHVHARLQVVHLGYQVSEVAEDNRQLQAERRRLEIEAATLRHPRRLRRLAEQRLGLREPVPGQVLPPLTKSRGRLAARDQGVVKGGR